MAERTPMVKVDGYWRELPAGDTTAGGGGSTPDPQYLGYLSGSGLPTTMEFSVNKWGFWGDTEYVPPRLYIAFCQDGINVAALRLL